MINFEDFVKIDLRIGKIIEAEKVEGSSKIIKTTVDLGEEKKVKIGVISDTHLGGYDDKLKNIVARHFPSILDVHLRALRSQ